MEIEINENDQTADPTMAESSGCSNSRIHNQYMFEDMDYKMMLDALTQNDLTKWQHFDLKEFKSIFASNDSLNSAVNKKEAKLCVSSVQGILLKNKIPATLSRNKYELVQTLQKVASGDVVHIQVQKRVQQRKKFNPQSLKALHCKQTLQQYSKDMLAVLKVDCIIRKTVCDWKSQSLFQDELTIDGLHVSHWFSQPEVCSDNNVRFHFVDACHILTCLRTKICTSGLPGCNVQRKAWETAALCPTTNLNISLITECVDKQSVPYARRIFEIDVEEAMHSYGYHKEATFCHLVREWFEAEDDRGIGAFIRCQRRMALRDWLLDGVSFDTFPPSGMYIKGIPSVTFESLLVHVERKLQLFAFTPAHSYNVRALGTQEVEQFFIILRDLDQNSKGTMKPDDIPHVMNVAVELDELRLSPDRYTYINASIVTIKNITIFLNH